MGSSHPSHFSPTASSNPQNMKIDKLNSAIIFTILGYKQVLNSIGFDRQYPVLSALCMFCPRTQSANQLKWERWKCEE